MKQFNKSPIFYMGNKERLIKKGLIDLFPKNINNYYEPFCGSGVVALNIKANNKYISDIDSNIVNLIKLFIEHDPIKLVNEIEKTINKYDLPKFSTDARIYKGNRNAFKQKYNILRTDYNDTRDILLLYALNIFSNSHMLRYNKLNNFNMPFGNGYFTDDCKYNILNNKYSDLSSVDNKDYKALYDEKFYSDDFVYLDPPYIGTTATYNENGSWTEKDDDELREFCDYLNNSGVKFALSNTFINKGKENNKLKEWAEMNNYNCYSFDGFTYCCCGKGNSKSKEVLITNYIVD